MSEYTIFLIWFAGTVVTGVVGCTYDIKTQHQTHPGMCLLITVLWPLSWLLVFCYLIGRGLARSFGHSGPLEIIKPVMLAVMLCGSAVASDCYVAPLRQRVVQKVYRQQVYAAPVVALQSYPVTYAYAVGQNFQEAALVAAVRADLRAEQQAMLQQQAAQQRDENKTLIRELLQEFRQSDTATLSGRPQSPTAPPDSAAGSDAAGTAAKIGKAVLEAKCILCHMPASKDVAREVGPPLFRDNGKVMDWSKQQIQRIYDKTHAGSMPPAPLPELNDDEFLAVEAYLTTLGLEPRPKREED